MSEQDGRSPAQELRHEPDGAAALLEAPAETEQRMTALELFFGLVFVFAITPVTGCLPRPDMDPPLRKAGDPRGALVRLVGLRVARQHRQNR